MVKSCFSTRKLSRLDTEKTRIHRESFRNVVEKNVMNPQPRGRELRIQEVAF
jgi:hypothetical protein